MKTFKDELRFVERVRKFFSIKKILSLWILNNLKSFQYESNKSKLKTISFSHGSISKKKHNYKSILVNMINH